MFINQILTKLKSLVYSKSETDSLLNGKASSSHTHTKSQITDFPSLATVATSGSYSDLSNKPTIPTNTNQLTNGAGFITSEIDSSGTDWVRFKSGLQICWGNMNFGSIEAGGTRDWVLTFPKSFVNSNYIAVCGNSSTGSNWMNNCFITYNRKTTAVNVAITNNTASASSANALTSLVTIGKWK